MRIFREIELVLAAGGEFLSGERGKGERGVCRAPCDYFYSYIMWSNLIFRSFSGDFAAARPLNDFFWQFWVFVLFECPCGFLFGFWCSAGQEFRRVGWPPPPPHLRRKPFALNPSFNGLPFWGCTWAFRPHWDLVSGETVRSLVLNRMPLSRLMHPPLQRFDM